MPQVTQGLTFNTLEELVDPAHTAVLVVDMQNDLCHPDGRFAQAEADISMMREIVPPMVRLLDEAREYGARIIFIQALMAEGGRTHSDAYMRLLRNISHAWPCVLEGTWGAEILAELKRQPNELVVTKYRSSAFVNTNLDTLLRNLGVRTTVIVGEQTPGCVEATVRGAADHDYYPVVVTDCIGAFNRELHAAAMKVMTARWDHATSRDLPEAWKKRAMPGVGAARRGVTER